MDRQWLIMRGTGLSATPIDIWEAAGPEYDARVGAYLSIQDPEMPPDESLARANAFADLIEGARRELGWPISWFDAGYQVDQAFGDKPDRGVFATATTHDALPVLPDLKL